MPINYKEIYKLPFTDIKKYLIGILLSIVPVINLFAIGYILETAKLAIRRKYILPEWDQFLRFFVDGLLAVIISALYTLPALIILLIGLARIPLDTLRSMILNDRLADVSLVFNELGPLRFVFFFLLFLSLYLFPIAVMIFVDKRKFGYAFNLPVVIGLAFTKHYAGPWFIALFTYFLLSTLLGYIPYIGQAIADFTGMTIMYAIVATAYGEAKQARL